MNTNRSLTIEEKWISAYESLVQYICEGYEEIIYEYTNDLSCRLFIQRGLEEKNKNMLSMEDRVNTADEKLKSILLMTKKCIHGDFPIDYFWFWGVPSNSEELTKEARLNRWIE